MSINTVKYVKGSEIRIHLFLGLPDPEPTFFVGIQIRIQPSTSKKIKKNLDFYRLWLLFDFLSDVNVLSKSNKQKKILETKTFFC